MEAAKWTMSVTHGRDQCETSASSPVSPMTGAHPAIAQAKPVEGVQHHDRFAGIRRAYTMWLPI